MLRVSIFVVVLLLIGHTGADAAERKSCSFIYSQRVVMYIASYAPVIRTDQIQKR
jgi:hypothetical protein